MKLFDIALYLLLPAVVLLHLAAAPYSKVEESFNLQATHDILVYGTPTGTGAGARLAAHYDHFVFAGAVPRTFVGPVLLAGLGQPVIAALDAWSGGTDKDNGPAAQLIVRALLGLANAAAMLLLARAVAAAGGRGAARWYVLLQASQFHCLFYASRALPNMFAFGLTTAAFAALLHPHPAARVAGRQRVAVSLLVLAGVVFRAEVALLLAAVAAYLVAVPLSSAGRLVRAGAVSGVVALALSVPIDTYFWQRRTPFWPELHGFLFNVVRGRASDWGVSPWHYYVSSALPRLLLNPLIPLLLLPVALRRPATRRPAALLVVPCLLFVGVYSLQPHKEARFVLYVVPPLTAAAALGADQLAKAARKNPRSRSAALAYAVALSVPACLAASVAMLLVSALNYPGGEALAVLRQIVRADPDAAAVVSAHADVLACMTGVTLFGSALGPALLPPPSLPVPVALQDRAPPLRAALDQPVQLVVDKTEDPRLLRDPAFWTRFDYVLAEDPTSVGGSPAAAAPSEPAAAAARQWDIVAVVQGYAGIEVLRPGQASSDPSAAGLPPLPVVGRGAVLAALRQIVRQATGGWWIGPRMAPRIYILRRVAGENTQMAATG